MTREGYTFVALVVTLGAVGCDRGEEPGGRDTSKSEPPPATTSSGSALPGRGIRAPTVAAKTPAPPAAAKVVLVAGGDVAFGRMRGQRLVREPGRDDFANLAALMRPADLRFVNLECPLSTYPLQGPMKMIFSGPPEGAEALVRGGIEVVSLANNHAWDYGKDGLLQTLANLERVRVAYVGAGRTRGDAYRPLVVEKNGLKLAFVAVTDVWNQPFYPHPGKEMVADDAGLLDAVKAARAVPGVDKVIVSFHGGGEYLDRPYAGTRELLQQAVKAGADVVIGHHPHVVQRVAFMDGKPIFYSLGNLLMRMVTGKPWTQFGMLARLELDKVGPTRVAVCPFRIHGLDPIPLAGDPDRRLYQAHFKVKLERLQRIGDMVEPPLGAKLGEVAEDGCMPVLPDPKPGRQ